MEETKESLPNRYSAL